MNESRKVDYRIICGMIQPESKVLDLGCGNGELLSYLVKEKRAKVQGIELSDEAIHQCVEKGLSVFHGNIDSGLSYYPDKSFDYVILNQSLQEVKGVEFVIREALRVGRMAIIGFPNFAYIKSRWVLSFQGKAPITPSLPYLWYTTPNLRFLSINDFKDFCFQKGFKILEVYYLGKNRPIRFLPNLFAMNALFLIEEPVAKEA